MDKSEEEWSTLESCDIFQDKSYSGGFNVDERAFALATLIIKDISFKLICMKFKKSLEAR